MYKYRPKTIIAGITDRIFRAGAACVLGIGWFTLLWGFSLPSIIAGLALGVMLWLCVRQFSKHMTQKREQQLRRMLGGELALDRLLLDPPLKAAFQCALWLAPRYPLIMERTAPWCVYGTLNKQQACIRLVARHPSQQTTVQQIVECARVAKAQQLDKTILCLTASASPEALAYAASLDPPIQIIDRDELISLAGCAHPATDEDLREIGRQKRTRRSPKEWLAVILDASRARRYLVYGLGMALFGTLTGSWYYAPPAAVCLALYTACRILLIRRRHWPA